MNSRLVLVALLGAVASMMAGCASNRIPIRARGPSGGAQGSAWELVVPGPDVVLALAAADTGEHPAYMTRRDAALGATTPSWAPVAMTAAGPTTIERSRTIHLRRSFDSFLFFTRPDARPGPATGARPTHPHPPPALPPLRYWDP